MVTGPSSPLPRRRRSKTVILCTTVYPAVGRCNLVQLLTHKGLCAAVMKGKSRSTPRRTWAKPRPALLQQPIHLVPPPLLRLEVLLREAVHLRAPRSFSVGTLLLTPPASKYLVWPSPDVTLVSRLLVRKIFLVSRSLLLPTLDPHTGQA